ncbi:MAG: energy transducer TonB [Mucilaginibacter sp.]
MRSTVTNINKVTTSLATMACAVVLLSAVSLKAVAQERYAMLTKTTVTTVVATDADVDSSLLASKTKPATKAPAFDIMGGSSPLDEILVVDYSAKKKIGAKTDISLNSEEVHPKSGWNSFERYVSLSAISADGKTGNVQVSFMVAQNGSVSDVKIKNGLSDIADQKAIELVKNGPTWVNKSTDGAKQVTVTVTFRPQNAGPVFF